LDSLPDLQGNLIKIVETQAEFIVHFLQNYFIDHVARHANINREFKMLLTLKLINIFLEISKVVKYVAAN